MCRRHTKCPSVLDEHLHAAMAEIICFAYFLFAYPALIADGTMWYVDFRVLSLLKSEAQGLRTNVYLGVLFGT